VLGKSDQVVGTDSDELGICPRQIIVTEVSYLGEGVAEVGTIIPARSAAATGVVAESEDAISDPPIADGVGPEFHDLPGQLVTEDRPGPESIRCLRGVQVGAADPAGTYAQDRIAGTGDRAVYLRDGKRSTDGIEQRSAHSVS
jgi:hypothetical protein